MALSCTNVNHSLTPQPRTPENAQLPDATALDGELIVWNTAGRLAFEQLQNRLHRRGPAALQAATQQPAHFVAFDVLRLAGTTTLTWPYSRRRAEYLEIFHNRQRRHSALGMLSPVEYELLHPAGSVKPSNSTPPNSGHSEPPSDAERFRRAGKGHRECKEAPGSQAWTHPTAYAATARGSRGTSATFPAIVACCGVLAAGHHTRSRTSTPPRPRAGGGRPLPGCPRRSAFGTASHGSLARSGIGRPWRSKSSNSCQ
ncbi:hypothetical protein ACRJ4W_09155 [Streptomyces sp. GLT-R25]